MPRWQVHLLHTLVELHHTTCFRLRSRILHNVFAKPGHNLHTRQSLDASFLRFFVQFLVAPPLVGSVREAEPTSWVLIMEFHKHVQSKEPCQSSRSSMWSPISYNLCIINPNQAFRVREQDLCINDLFYLSRSLRKRSTLFALAVADLLMRPGVR